MTPEEIQAFLKKLEDAGELEDQNAKPEYSKRVNFYLSYRPNPTLMLEPLFERIAVEIAAHEAAEAKALGKGSNKRAADVQVRFVAAIRALALNTLHAHTKLIAEHLHLAISLDSNNYSANKRYNPSFLAFRQVQAAVRGMVALGYIEVHRAGYRDPLTGKGEMTRIHGLPKLFDAMNQAIGSHELRFYSDFTNRDDETIILRDKEKRPAEYEDTYDTRIARDRLSRINAVLARHTYALDVPKERSKELTDGLLKNYHEEPDYAQPYIDFTAIRLYRIFSENNFNRGGRFYRAWWQNMPKDFRPMITIDGKPTVELDYVTFHPTMLYAECGLSLDAEPYFIDQTVHRDAGKVAFNALLNSHGLPLGAAPIGYFHPDGITWSEFLDAMLAHHEPVAHLLTEGHGLSLQYQDSELAESILLHFADKDIPCLPIHDSFIVPEEHKDELESVMKQQFLSKFGVDIQLK